MIRKNMMGDVRENKTADVPVVAAGASAGGLESLTQLLEALPEDTGLAFVFIQHLDPNHESLMAELLSRHSKMPVVEAQDEVEIEADHVYMIPPNCYIEMSGDVLRLVEPVKDRGMRMSINHFFRSLAEARGPRAMAIVLSGTGTDGTLGLKEIKAAGGLVIAQEPESALFGGMPRSAVSTGSVDLVVPIAEMPQQLLRHKKSSFAKRSAPPFEDRAPRAYEAILRLLRAHTDYDFRCYKTGTLGRRIERRMSVRSVKKAEDYVKLLRQDPEEVQALFKDLLIGVTRFFRESEAWEVLAERAIAPLVAAKKPPENAIRLWVPGCATGEEAYGLAMVLFEELDRRSKAVDVQGFATDLDAESIEVARSGHYPTAVKADIAPQRFQQFFHDQGDLVRVNKRLRESIVFAVHNLVSDPPFSNLDLISCRNLLIYLEQDIQATILQAFYYALRDGGYLFLGNSESLSGQGELFEPVSKRWRIYRKAEGGPRRPPRLPLTPVSLDGAAARARYGRKAAGRRGPSATKWGTLGTADMAKRLLIDHLVPPAVLVDRRHRVLYQHGRLRDYLDFPEGFPAQDLSTLALPGLRTRLRSLVQRALKSGEAVSELAPRVARGEDSVIVRIGAQPVNDPLLQEPVVVVTFLDVAEDPEKDHADVEPRADEPTLAQQLEYELQVTREDLHSTIEELETLVEEYHASHEESMSVNEELQSTNEELETSREELQSLNEELTTVNRQLEEKMRELESTNDDLRNLLESTEIATLFLDGDLHIRRFTPAAAELLRILDSDRGRPLSDLAPQLEDPQLSSDIEQVMARLVSLEREVSGSDPRWFIRRVAPYRTGENKIEGVAITYTDVTELKESRDRLEVRERQQAAIAGLSRRALGEASLDEIFEESVAAIASNLEVELCKILELLPGDGLLLRVGVGWDDDLVGQAVVPSGIDSQAGYTLQASKAVVVEDMATEKRFYGPELLLDHEVVSGMSIPIGPGSRTWGVLGVHTRSRREFTIDDVNFLEAMANILAEVIRSRS